MGRTPSGDGSAIPAPAEASGRRPRVQLPPATEKAVCSDARQGSGGPTGGPADLFPCDSPWYQDVSQAAVAPDSASILAAMADWGGADFTIDFSFVFFHATPTTPRLQFTGMYVPDSDMVPVLVPLGGALEEEEGYVCTMGGDQLFARRRRFAAKKLR